LPERQWIEKERARSIANGAREVNSGSKEAGERLRDAAAADLKSAATTKEEAPVSSIVAAPFTCAAE